IRAINAWVEGAEGVVRLVVDKVPAARKALAARGWPADEHEVLEVELADKPGSLAAVAGALGDAGVNVTHVFGGPAGARKASVFLGVSDLKAALKAAR
ncbi:MAG TPA: ACT domain-containing protein, partial [Anaeromyxobacter sp.]|nr:ACT domain-containing protein [Anaeromyxobacter sp.]